jgi:hypothetical protein
MNNDILFNFIMILFFGVLIIYLLHPEPRVIMTRVDMNNISKYIQ